MLSLTGVTLGLLMIPLFIIIFFLWLIILLGEDIAKDLKELKKMNGMKDSPPTHKATEDKEEKDE
ncbi:MAG: hypothetical protein HQ536_00205 [Parcubacteria group bacterium]|nr:hypothetical protein [Parcubacteria group bacterium]